MQKLSFLRLNSTSGHHLDGLFIGDTLPEPFLSINIQAYDCSLDGIMEPFTGKNGEYYTAAMEEIVARIIMYTKMMNKLGVDFDENRQKVKKQLLFGASYKRLAIDIDKSKSLQKSFLEEALDLTVPPSVFSTSHQVQKPLAEVLQMCLNHLVDDGVLELDESKAAYLPSPMLIEKLASKTVN